MHSLGFFFGVKRVKHLISAFSQLCPVMMWPHLPSDLLSTSTSLTSKPKALWTVPHGQTLLLLRFNLIWLRSSRQNHGQKATNSRCCFSQVPSATTYIVQHSECHTDQIVLMLVDQCVQPAPYLEQSTVEACGPFQIGSFEVRESAGFTNSLYGLLASLCICTIWKTN